MSRSARTFGLLAWLSFAALPAQAQDAAQAPSEEPLEAAREAAEQGRFAEARDILRRALDDSAIPAVAFNLSLMLRETGELVAARDTLQQMLSNGFGELPEERRGRVAELLAEVTADLATLEISVDVGPTQIEVDGRIAGTADPTQAMRYAVDPGPHVVVGRREGREARQRVEATRGGVAPVALVLRPAPPPTAARVDPLPTPTAPTEPADERGEEDLTALWVVLAIVGAGLIAGGISLGVVLGTQTDNTAPLPMLPNSFLGRAATLLER